jgi:hypothetical protein
MTINLPSRFSRLFARARCAAMAAALVAASAQVALAAPLTQSFSFSSVDSTFGAFDTTLGTLLGIDITLDSGVSAVNPLSNGGTNQGTCFATFIGGSYTVSAPGGSPTLLSLTGDGSMTFPCGQFEVALTKHAAVSLESSLFGAFSSVGVTPITLAQTIVGGSVAVVEGAGISVVSSEWDPRLTHGQLTYTYCAVGDNCGAEPPPPAVPEPATVTTLVLGLAGLLGRLRTRR